MLMRFRAYFHDESGAVTVDWVVLTALTAAFGIIVLLTLASGTQDVAQGMQTTLSSVEVTQLPVMGVSQ